MSVNFGVWIHPSYPTKTQAPRLPRVRFGAFHIATKKIVSFDGQKDKYNKTHSSFGATQQKSINTIAVLIKSKHVISGKRITKFYIRSSECKEQGKDKQSANKDRHKAIFVVYLGSKGDMCCDILDE
jgi:hypothetical protein